MQQTVTHVQYPGLFFEVLCFKSNALFSLFFYIPLQEKQKKEAYDLAKLEMLTGGFLDTAALESNAALLALLLKQATNDGFFWTVVALVVVAVCLQVAIGVILAFRVSQIRFFSSMIIIQSVKPISLYIQQVYLCFSTSGNRQVTIQK